MKLLKLKASTGGRVTGSGADARGVAVFVAAIFMSGPRSKEGRMRWMMDVATDAARAVGGASGVWWWWWWWWWW
jgi:hypothetical protein